MSAIAEASMLDTVRGVVRQEMRDSGVVPWLAEVVSVEGGRVGVQALDEEAPHGTTFARVEGLELAPGDDVLMWGLGREAVVLGKVQSEAPGVQRLEGGLNADNVRGRLKGEQIGLRTIADEHINGRLDWASVPELKLSDGARLVASPLKQLRFHTSQFITTNLGDGEVQVEYPIVTVADGNTTIVTGMKRLRFHSDQFVVTDLGDGEAQVEAAAQHWSDVSSGDHNGGTHTSTTTFKTAGTLSVSLPPGTWVVNASGSIVCWHETADGEVQARIEIGGTGGLVAPGVSKGVLTRVTLPTACQKSPVAGGSAVNVLIRFRCGTAGTVRAGAWNIHVSAYRQS